MKNSKLYHLAWCNAECFAGYAKAAGVEATLEQERETQVGLDLDIGRIESHGSAKGRLGIGMTVLPGMRVSEIPPGRSRLRVGPCRLVEESHGLADPSQLAHRFSQANESSRAVGIFRDRR